MAVRKVGPSKGVRAVRATAAGAARYHAAGQKPRMVGAAKKSAMPSPPSASTGPLKTGSSKSCGGISTKQYLKRGGKIR